MVLFKQCDSNECSKLGSTLTLTLRKILVPKSGTHLAWYFINNVALIYNNNNIAITYAHIISLLIKMINVNCDDSIISVFCGVSCEVIGKSCDALVPCPGPWDSYIASSAENLKKGAHILHVPTSWNMGALLYVLYTQQHGLFVLLKKYLS